MAKEADSRWQKRYTEAGRVYISILPRQHDHLLAEFRLYLIKRAARPGRPAF